MKSIIIEINMVIELTKINKFVGRRNLSMPVYLYIYSVIYFQLFCNVVYIVLARGVKARGSNDVSTYSIVLSGGSTGAVDGTYQDVTC